jgi:hypothetical protein
MANRDRDVLGVKEVGLVLPVQARSGNPGVRQPVESDVVEEVVAREGVRQVSAEDPLDETGLPVPSPWSRVNAAARWASLPVRTASVAGSP